MSTEGYLFLINAHSFRQIIEGALDVHPSKNAIVVYYSVDARVLSEHMETMVADMKQCRKM